MASKFLLWLGAFALISSPAAGWDIPADNGTMGKAAIDEILGGNDYPETGTYRQAAGFIDFTANGQNFPQIVLIFTPDKPRLPNGKQLVLVGGAPGTENALGFRITLQGKAS